MPLTTNDSCSGELTVSPVLRAPNETPLVVSVFFLSVGLAEPPNKSSSGLMKPLFSSKSFSNVFCTSAFISSGVA